MDVLNRVRELHRDIVAHLQVITNILESFPMSADESANTFWARRNARLEEYRQIHQLQHRCKSTSNSNEPYKTESPEAEPDKGYDECDCGYIIIG